MEKTDVKNLRFGTRGTKIGQKSVWYPGRPQTQIVISGVYNSRFYNTCSFFFEERITQKSFILIPYLFSNFTFLQFQIIKFIAYKIMFGKAII